MTEDEAKTKMCCGPRAGGLGEDINCIGTACMAWRWSEPPVSEKTEIQEVGSTTPRVKIRPPAGEGWTQVNKGVERPGRPDDLPYRWAEFARIIPGEPGRGFCGLAGEVPHHG